MKYTVVIFFLLAFQTMSAQDTTRLSLLFVGDIMGHDSQISAAYDATTKAYDYSKCFQYVKPYLESPDVTIGNLEVTLAGPPYKGYPQFSSPDQLAFTLKDVGFDALVTANNHCVDRGRKGIGRTIQMLDSVRMPHTGTFIGLTDRLNNYPLMVEKNGFTFALLNYTFSTNGISVPSPTVVNMIDTTQMHADIVHAKDKKPDFIVAFIHWGIEYESLPRKDQKKLTEFCFKNGVDIVIGAHPHVIQPMEWRKAENKFIVYSLGNFVSGQRKQYTDGGAMAYLEMQKIRFENDSSVTTIDSAAFQLNWVYRTADTKKTYYVLPVESFEQDTLKVIADAESKRAFTQFVKDSRALYKKHNVNVSERFVYRKEEEEN